MIGTPATGIIPSGNRAFIGSFNRFDPDAQSYFARLLAAGSDTAYKTAINSFVVGCKNDLIWDKLTELYLLAGVSNLDGCLVKLKHAGTPLLSNYSFINDDYVASGSGAGLKGDGLGKYLDPAITAGPDNDQCISFYSTAAQVSGNGNPITAITNGNNDATRFGTLITATTAVSRVSTYASGTLPYTSGHYLLSVSDEFILINGGKTDLTITATITAGGILSLYRPGNFGSDMYSGRLTFAHIGTGLTDAQALALSNRVNALMTAIGCNVY